MTDEIDFEAEGLLDGLEGPDRESRIVLLERLADDGVPLQELREAVEQGRLTVLPVERLLAGEQKYSTEELAERSGVPIELLERQWRSVGLAVPEPDEVVLSNGDLEAAHRLRVQLDSGLDIEAIAELGRTVAVAMSQFAAASRQVMASTFVGDAESEAEVAERIYQGARALMPMVGPTLDYVYRLHLREQLRHVAFATEEGGGGTAASVLTTICFADLVGFTKLGEELPPEKLGRVTGRLEELAREVAHGPVRLVKLLGDAAMLVSPDTGALVGSCLDLLEEMSAEEGMPLIRAGIARGPAVTRGGDFYGAPVNLASRITEIARPGSVLVSSEVRDEVPDDFRFSQAGSKHLKGIRSPVELYRIRDLDDDGAEDDPGSEEEDADGSAESHRRRRRRSRRHA